MDTEKRVETLEREVRIWRRVLIGLALFIIIAIFFSGDSKSSKPAQNNPSFLTAMCFEDKSHYQGHGNFKFPNLVLIVSCLIFLLFRVTRDTSDKIDLNRVRIIALPFCAAIALLYAVGAISMCDVLGLAFYAQVIMTFSLVVYGPPLFKAASIGSMLAFILVTNGYHSSDGEHFLGISPSSRERSYQWWAAISFTFMTVIPGQVIRILAWLFTLRQERKNVFKKP